MACNQETYWQRKSEHRCVSCNQQDERTLAGKIYCAQCNEKRAIWRHLSTTDEQKSQRAEDLRLTYNWCRQKHMCVVCGRKDARTMSGLTRCKMCAAKKNRADRKYSMNHPLSEEQKNQDAIRASIRNRKLYQERKEAGLCTRCGKHKADGDFTTCIDCRLKRREYNSLHVARNNPGRQGNGLTKREWKELGLCPQCGNVLDGQLKKDGKPSKLCRKCYATKTLPG